MPHKRVARKSLSSPAALLNYGRLRRAIEAANERMVGRAASVVNQALVLRNWLIGAYLVHYEQGGADRAKYGTRLLERLAEDLAKDGIKGLDARTLRDCRTLFQVYPQIRGPLDPESDLPGILSTPAVVPSNASGSGRSIKRIRGPVDPESGRRPIAAAQSTPLAGELVVQLSWSKLLQLIRIDDPLKRAFYENGKLCSATNVPKIVTNLFDPLPAI